MSIRNNKAKVNMMKVIKSGGAGSPKEGRLRAKSMFINLEKYLFICSFLNIYTFMTGPLVYFI